MRKTHTSDISAGTEISPFDALLNRPAFSVDAWHAMNERDNMQVEQEVLHGGTNAEFVYAMMVQGKLVTGISVVGARQLAVEYGGIKSRPVGSIDKKGSLFVFWRSGQLEVRTIHELDAVPDYYEAITQVEDIKTGNSIEIRKKEERFGRKRDGGTFERPHYDTIAESKAFRNGVLSLIPQTVVNAFKIRCLRAGLGEGVFDGEPAIKAAISRYLAAPKQSPAGSERTLDQLREAAIGYGAKNGISLDRSVLNQITYTELHGIAASANDGIDSFRAACAAFDLVSTNDAKAGKMKDKPDYGTLEFEKNLQTWRDLIESGKRTAEQIIAMVSSKATLSDGQISEIMSIKMGDQLSSDEVRQNATDQSPVPRGERSA